MAAVVVVSVAVVAVVVVEEVGVAVGEEAKWPHRPTSCLLVRRSFSRANEALLAKAEADERTTKAERAQRVTNR